MANLSKLKYFNFGSRKPPIEGHGEGGGGTGRRGGWDGRWGRGEGGDGGGSGEWGGGGPWGGGGDIKRTYVHTSNASKGFKQTTEFFYNPDDLKPDTAIGVLYPLNKAVGGQSLTGNPTNPINAGSVYSTTANGAGVFRLSYTTEDQSITNLKMLLLTRMGERLYHPTFGTRLQELVFDPNTDELIIRAEQELERVIKFWLPYIIINDIFVNNTDSYGDIQHRIEIKLRFQVTEQGANQEIILIVTGDSVNAIQ